MMGLKTLLSLLGVLGKRLPVAFMAETVSTAD